jgi:hypothetical protein
MRRKAAVHAIEKWQILNKRRQAKARKDIIQQNLPTKGEQSQAIPTEIPRLETFRPNQAEWAFICRLAKATIPN